MPSHSDAGGPGAARQLGLSTATALVVASMIGTGIFTTSGFLLADLQSRPLVLLAWLTGGVLAGLGALCYGALARVIPESGGEYIFLSRTLHPAAGYLAGWVSLLVGFSAPMAMVAMGFGEYLKDWLPRIDPRIPGTALIAAFSLLHALHVRRGAAIQNWIVAIKVVLIVAFVLFAATRLPALPAPAPGADPPFVLSAFAVSLVWISFSYSGWNAAVYIGGEVRDPERTLPRALILGTALVAILYLALNAVFIYAAPIEKLAGQVQVGRIAAAAVGGSFLADAVTWVILLALVTSASSLSMAGPRVCARMAEDGYLPRVLAARGGPPRAAILAQAIVSLVLVWTLAYDRLMTYIGFTLSLSTAAAVAGLVRLRLNRGPTLPVLGWPWLPFLFLVSVLGVASFTIYRKPWESLIGVATLLVGLAFWRLQTRKAAPPPW